MSPSRDTITSLVRRIGEIPYSWPGEPDADAARRAGRST
jgi:hypothetical protein